MVYLTTLLIYRRATGTCPSIIPKACISTAFPENLVKSSLTAIESGKYIIMIYVIPQFIHRHNS